MPDPYFNFHRRNFLSLLSASGAFFAAHGFAAGDPVPTSAGPAQQHEAHRILALELLSAAPLRAMKDFYHRLLGLSVTEDHPDRLTIAAGATAITFVNAGPADGQPFYHFAFNIPENKIEPAWRWQKQRTPLLPIPARLRDAQYPADVVNYAHWNAHSIFFFDPAGNVVEYIARHDLNSAASGDFSSDDILYASEIAFVTDDVSALASQLKTMANVPQYRGGDDNFTALGDEHGLLLVMKRGRVISFDSPDKKAVSIFRTTAKVRGQQPATHHLPGQPYTITVEEKR